MTTDPNTPCSTANPASSDDVAGDELSLRQVASRVPGYEGYALPGRRDAADRAFRDFLLGYLGRLTQALDAEAFDPGRAIGAEEMRVAMRVLRDRVQDLADQTRSAPYAFSEFMTAPAFDGGIPAEYVGRDHAILHLIDEIQSLLSPTLSDATDLRFIAAEISLGIEALVTAVRERQTAISDFTLSTRR